ncbi:Ribose-phosphate pyrophosphokinase 1 [Globomyces sp. JEL0801]|nr:Ribose-phosphate pyrophosphokinase 1 [Globomyces sp. JEL0801]
MHIIDKLGLTSSPAIVKKFPNAEISVELGESVRDADVFLIQSGSHSMNELPYFPYNKQSKKKKTRGAISAKLVANMLTVAGVDHIITLELHSSLAQGFFNKPCDNLVALPILAKYITENFDLSKCIMISKNAGGARRVTQLADRLRIDFALIHRERYHVRVGDTATDQLETKITLVDDVIDGTHSFIDSCEHLKICESDQVYIVAIHGILSGILLVKLILGDALKQIEMSNAIDGIITTNSFPVGYDKLRATSKLKQIDISSLFAEAIRRTHNGESMSYLFHTAM